jgi:Tol biopolymer transport system component
MITKAGVKVLDFGLAKLTHPTGADAASVSTATATPLPSPDGQNFAFLAFDSSGGRSLWIRPLNSQAAQQIPGTENAEQPFWSADGRSIGFYAQGKLKKVSISSGGPQTITDIADIARGLANIAAWNGKGDINFVCTL